METVGKVSKFTLFTLLSILMVPAWILMVTVHDFLLGLIKD